MIGLFFYRHGACACCAADSAPVPAVHAIEEICLFLLMTVLSQSFLTLVSGHLVTFSLLSAGHN